MTDRRQKTGRRGEDEACMHLSGLGHTIVARNWRHSHQEIDIISFKGDEIHFVEVKSRTAPVVADPSVNVNSAKWKNVVKAANAFLNSSDKAGLSPDMDVCFDVITVVFAKDGGSFEIEYYPKAFIPIYV